MEKKSYYPFEIGESVKKFGHDTIYTVVNRQPGKYYGPLYQVEDNKGVIHNVLGKDLVKV